MKYILTLLVLLMAWASPVLADITIDHPAYAYRTAANQTNGAAFFTLKNSGDKDVALTNAQSDVASMTEIHTITMTDDVMEMRQVEALTIPAGGALTLEPTGNHIMLMGLSAPLELDASFPLTITLDNGEVLVIDTTIVNPGFTHAEPATEPKDTHENHTDH